MHTLSTLHKLMGWSFGGAIMMAALSGCEPKAAAEAQQQAPPTEDTGTAGADIIGSTEAVGGILLLANGELRVVDAKGNPVKPCRLPGYEKQRDAADLPECQKIRDTTIMNIESIAVVRHTGSICMTIGGGGVVHGDQFIPGSSIQLPPGCTN